VPSLGFVLGSNPTKAFGFPVEGWCALKKEFALCPSRKTSLSNAIYGNSSVFSDDVITIPAQDLHENLLCIRDAAFPGLSNQIELN